MKYWMNSGYILKSGGEAKNRDLLEKLVSCNFNFSNLRRTAKEDQPIVDHAKKLYYDRNLSMLDTNIGNITLDDNVKVDNSNTISDEMFYSQSIMPTSELVQPVERIFTNTYQTTLPVFKHSNKLQNQQIQNVGNTSHDQLQPQRSQYISTSSNEYYQRQHQQSSLPSRSYNRNNSQYYS
jgi:hypothetical protein